jgi:hypothetical protein
LYIFIEIDANLKVEFEELEVAFEKVEVMEFVNFELKLFYKFPSIFSNFEV